METLCAFTRRISAGIAALAACAFLLALLAAPARAADSRMMISTFEARVLGVINSMRQQHDLRPLRLSLPLTEAARQHSFSMAEDGYFSHSSADGSSFAARLQHYYSTGRYRRWTVGENLLWQSPSIDANGALKLWMASPDHRANLLSPLWREIGISAVHDAAAGGVYTGDQVTVITTDFGARD